MRLTLPFAALLIAMTAACGSTADSGSPATTAEKKTTVDACTLLKADEIEAVIGANDGGQHGGGVGDSVCTWENEDNAHSVTLAIGGAGTAAGGKLIEVVKGRTAGRL
jgi:hypothetical protein